ncbi:MAG: hypothetical protein IT204_17100 [Fimbriimonadaceae bacterium]|nr:hypothetical protein [Fimbriimonadaceae bacterium]
MRERHDREQYFFDPATLDALATWVAGFAHPALLCAPLLGRVLHQRGVAATVLDIDERFADLPGFVRYDLHRPRWLDRQFGLIVCDPPFFSISLVVLRRALQMLANHDPQQPLAVSFVVRRQARLLHSLAGFNLRPTGWRLGYATVDPSERNQIELYSNVAVP